MADIIDPMGLSHMSEMEAFLVEFMMRNTMFPPGVTMRSGYIREISKETGEEVRIQILETSGPCRVNVSLLAKALEAKAPKHYVLQAGPMNLFGK